MFSKTWRPSFKTATLKASCTALSAQRKKGSVGPLERMVTWTTANHERSFIFTGGIVMIGNQPIDDVPVLRAMKTRIACLHLEVTADELRALMRDVARKGYEYRGIQLKPAACREVCEYLIEQSLTLTRSLDMRLLINSFHDRLQWEERDAACHWKDLVATRLRERPAAPANGLKVGSQRSRKRNEQLIVQEILSTSKDPQEQVRLWVERTGKSQAAWYRRRAEGGPVRFAPSKGEKTRKVRTPRPAPGASTPSGAPPPDRKKPLVTPFRAFPVQLRSFPVPATSAKYHLDRLPLLVGVQVPVAAAHLVGLVAHPLVDHPLVDAPRCAVR